MAERSFDVAEKIVQKQLIHVLETADDPIKHQTAIKDIRESIIRSKNYKEGYSIIQTEYRASLYDNLSWYLKHMNNLSSKIRIVYMDILAEGLLNDNPDDAKVRILKYLADILNATSVGTLSSEFRMNIEKAYNLNDQLHDRYMFCILIHLNSPIVEQLLSEYSNYVYVPYDTPHVGMHESMGWAVTLYRARRGEARYVRRMLELAETAMAARRYYFLFFDISSVHDELCVRYLHEYLKMDIRSGGDCVYPHGELLACHAAMALYLMLEDFPECKYLDMHKTENLAPFRQWMNENHELRFRKEKPLDDLLPHDIRESNH